MTSLTSRRWFFGFGVLSLAGATAAACGNNGASSQFGGNIPDSGAKLDGQIPPFGQLDGGEAGAIGTLSIQPADDVVSATGGGMTIPYKAFAGGSTTPITAAWSLDSATLGTIANDGTFTISGNAGGTIHVIAGVGNQTAQTSLTVNLHVIDNPSNVDSGTMAKLRAGGSADNNFVWLYPYDLTVFPRGLLPPLLQWANQTDPTFIYVHTKSKTFEFEGFYPSTSAPGTPQFQLSPAIWKSITDSAGSNDPVSIGITKISGTSAVSGPINETWTIAQGSLQGLIYYDTYDSPLAAGNPDAGPGDNDMGAVMRIKPGASLPEVLIGGKAKGSCTVCHTVSANGTVLSASLGHTSSKTYALGNDAGDPTATSTQTNDTYAFAALTPDGKYLLSTSAIGLDAGLGEGGVPNTADDFSPNIVSMTQDQNSVLYDTSNGTMAPVATIPGASKALMPAFSPDGKQVVFNWYNGGLAANDGGIATLATATFDEATKTFGTPQIAVPTAMDIAGGDLDNTIVLGWPSFFPDGKSFVYQVSGDTDDYASYTPGYTAADGQLLMFYGASTPAATNTEHMYNASGVAPVSPHAGYTRAPDGTPLNATPSTNSDVNYPYNLDYEPTVLPVAAGGYYWVVFTSRRYYGNTITDTDPSDTVRKKLWIAAVDINGDPATDTSHPAFFLAGQELASGNLRGFFSLPPCQQNGNSCETGSSCCTGFCRETTSDGGTPIFACVPPPTTCSNENEKCTTASDCCDAKTQDFECINGFCARPTPK